MSGSINEKWNDRARASLAGGVNSPVRSWSSVGGTPLFFERGAGALLFDVEGREYRDYVGSWGPMILGHAKPEVVNAVCGAAAKSTSFGAPCPGEVELAEAVKSRFPSIELARFVSSGTEAAMTALRLARGYTGRDVIIKFEGNYHGHSDSLLVSAGSGALALGAPASLGVTEREAGQTLVVPYNSKEKVKDAFAASGDTIAAVIVEPWAGNMGLVPPEPGFLEFLREITSARGALLIFDEVITGFRVPEGGVQNRVGVLPDLTVLGKIVGGGMPVGALGGRADVMELLAPTGQVYQAGTLSGNPLAMASGLATLALLDAGVYARLEALASRLESGLRKAAANASLPVSLTRLGSALGLFFAESVPKNLAEAKRGRCDLYPAFFHGMLERGDYFAPSPFETIFVSAAHTGEMIDQTIAAAGEVFTELAKR